MERLVPGGERVNMFEASNPQAGGRERFNDPDSGPPQTNQD